MSDTGTGSSAAAPLPPFKVPREALAPGDRAPNFILPDLKGEFRAFYERVRGRPTVLVFAPAAEAPTLTAFVDRQRAFDEAGADLMVVFGGNVEDLQRVVPSHERPAFVLADPKGAVSRGYATAARLNPQFAGCYLLDANQRLLARRSNDPAALEPIVDWSYREIAAFAAHDSRLTSGGRAPVLLVPRVLDPAMCKALIERWEHQHEEGQVTSVVDGKEVTRVHESLKRRRDHAIQDPAVLRALAATVGRRLAPELVKAFHFDAFRFDRFNITCYDSERGDYFRAHRDSESASTSERRFAVTLNLNEDFEGGELLFPEYGPHRYVPPAGGAVVFSCSLLHEALPVTKGRRFTLLTFLSAAPAGAQQARAPQPAAPPRPAEPGFDPGGFNPGGSATAGNAGSGVAPGGFNPSGFNPGAPAPAGDKAGPTTFAPGTNRNGLTRAGD